MIHTKCHKCGRFHHADDGCRKTWGRRGFLGMLAGAIATAAIPDFLMHHNQVFASSTLHYGNTITVDLFLDGAFPRGASIMLNGGRVLVGKVDPDPRRKSYIFKIDGSTACFAELRDTYGPSKWHPLVGKQCLNLGWKCPRGHFLSGEWDAVEQSLILS